LGLVRKLFLIFNSQEIKIANCWFSPHSLVICTCNLAKTSVDSELAGERHA